MVFRSGAAGVPSISRRGDCDFRCMERASIIFTAPGGTIAHTAVSQHQSRPWRYHNCFGLHIACSYVVLYKGDGKLPLECGAPSTEAIRDNLELSGTMMQVGATMGAGLFFLLVNFTRLFSASTTGSDDVGDADSNN